MKKLLVEVLPTLITGIFCIAIIYHLKGKYDNGFRDGYRQCIKDVERIISNTERKYNSQVFNPYTKQQ